MQTTSHACLFASFILAGCAGTSVHQVRFECNSPSAALSPALQVTCSNALPSSSSGADDAKQDGIRYYEASPYLLVYSDGKGGLISKLLHLPDLTKKRVIKPYAYLAANHSTLTFTNGILTQSKVVVDETLVPKAVIGVLEQSAMAALGRSMNNAGLPSTRSHPPPHLFKVELSNGQARLVGGPGVDANGSIRPIDVTVSDPDGGAAPAAPAASSAK